MANESIDDTSTEVLEPPTADGQLPVDQESPTADDPAPSANHGDIGDAAPVDDTGASYESRSTGVDSDDSNNVDDRPPADFSAIEAALDKFHARTESYESTIRRMQTRIEELQADQVRELLKPVILKLAALHTEATGAEERAAARDDDSARKDFGLFVSEIEETLALLDIEPIGVAPLDLFEPSRHAARRRIDTEDQSLDRRVATVIRQGFSYTGAERVFVPAVVTVYRSQSVTEDATTQESAAPA